MPTPNRWKWKLVNNRRKQEVGGEVTSKMQAITAAEAAQKEHGLHGTVTTITSPRGITFTARPAMKGMNIVWERD